MNYYHQLVTSRLLSISLFFFASAGAMSESVVPERVLMHGISLFSSYDIDRLAQVNKGWNKSVKETVDHRKDFIVCCIKNFKQIEINEKQIGWNEYANAGTFVDDTYSCMQRPLFFHTFLSGVAWHPIYWHFVDSKCIEHFELKKYFEVTTPDKTRFAQIYRFGANQPLPHCRAASLGWLIYFQPYFTDRGYSCVYSFKKLDQGKDNSCLYLLEMDKTGSSSISRNCTISENILVEVNNLLKRIEVLKNDSNTKRMVICDKEVLDILTKIIFDK